jgi:protein-tyrosine phosphatase
MSQFLNNDCGLVCPRLFVGSLSAANDIVSLNSNNIKRVLTVAGKLSVKIPANTEHKVINIADHPSQNILPFLQECVQFLDPVLLAEGDSSDGVLVHCASGVSRSVTVCCAWLMMRRGMTLAAALALVRECRPLAGPNSGFYAQLEALEESGGDIGKASELFLLRLGSTACFTDALFAQRERANTLHEQIDHVEEVIKSTRAATADQAEGWMSTLKLLLLEIEREDGAVADGRDLAPKLVGTLGIKDRISKMIRKDAVTKCRRLLAELMPASEEQRDI